MVLIGLLLVALACLVIGLVMASAPWLIGSLVASAVAGFVLWRQRDRIGASSGVQNDTGGQAAAPTTSAPARPAVQPPAPAVKPDTTQQVWVVDTMPQFHSKDCAAILNLDAEAIPLDQALEDGFTECTVCTPGPSASTAEQVWVVDGRPDYHVEDCRSLKIASTQQGRDAQPIPRGQALGDGFSACPDCRPDGAAADTAQPAQPGQTVWVVDGRPRYHLSDCMIIKDQQAEEIPFAQAEEDGFMPCTLCSPTAARV